MEINAITLESGSAVNKPGTYLNIPRKQETRVHRRTHTLTQDNEVDKFASKCDIRRQI